MLKDTLEAIPQGVAFLLPIVKKKNIQNKFGNIVYFIVILRYI
jgi:hypothetical protein